MLAVAYRCIVANGSGGSILQKRTGHLPASASLTLWCIFIALQVTLSVLTMEMIDVKLEFAHLYAPMLALDTTVVRLGM